MYDPVMMRHGLTDALLSVHGRTMGRRAPSASRVPGSPDPREYITPLTQSEKRFPSTYRHHIFKRTMSATSPLSLKSKLPADIDVTDIDEYKTIKLLQSVYDFASQGE